MEEAFCFARSVEFLNGIRRAMTAPVLWGPDCGTVLEWSRFGTAVLCNAFVYYSKRRVTSS